MTRCLNGLCGRNYTDEEVFKLKSSLHMTIVVYPLCSSGSYSLDEDDFYTSHLGVAARCMQGYMADAVRLSALAANGALEKRASETGVNKSHLIIDKTDYATVTAQLINASFSGRTGLLEFDNRCHRVANSFIAANFIVSGDDLRTFSFGRCKLDFKSYIYTYNGGGMVHFVCENATLSNSGCFNFKDNTTNVPLDSPKRPYIRRELITHENN